MSIKLDTVEQIARLAKLEISQEQAKRYASDLSNILDLVAQMKQCETDGIAPMTHPFDASLRMRPDEVSESNQREKFQACAPAAQEGLYVVPKVLD